MGTARSSILRCSVVALLIALAQYSPADAGQNRRKNETVMTPGMRITATTAAGTLSITAVDELTRCYTWEGATRCVEMWPRTERWYGSLGLYHPGPGAHWKEHRGITRCVVEEG